jgi:CRAL/TRIO domain
MMTAFFVLLLLLLNFQTVYSSSSSSSSQNFAVWGHRQPLQQKQPHQQQQQQQHQYHRRQPRQRPQQHESPRYNQLVPAQAQHELLAPRPRSPPPPPKVLPLRFLRAGKDDPIVGLQRYEATLTWRKHNHIDTILRESFPHYSMIKQHYPQYFHYTGYNQEPCFYEFPAKANLHALRRYNITVPMLIRHYCMMIEFQWQMLQPNDTVRSIYIIDLEGISMRQLFGDTLDFIKQMTHISSSHYPERAGYVYILNVPTWFKLIWNTIRPMIDASTLQRIHILRGWEEILHNLRKHIPLQHIPPIYGGTSVPLGYSPQEQILSQLIEHNTYVASTRTDRHNAHYPHDKSGCSLCEYTPVRSY